MDQLMLSGAGSAGGVNTSASMNNNESVWATGAATIASDSGFTRTAAGGRYLFGATDNSLDKVQIGGGLAINFGDLRIFDHGGANEMLVSYSGLNGSTGKSLSFSGAQATGSGLGGQILFQAGAGGSSSGPGGGVRLLAGNAVGTANGGQGLFAGGTAGGTGTGGKFTIGGGQNTNFGNGHGGAIELIGGESVFHFGNCNGGDLNFNPGRSYGSGTKGIIHIRDDLTAGGSSTYGTTVGTGTVVIGNVGPGTSTLTLNKWIPIKLDGVSGYLPYFS